MLLDILRYSDNPARTGQKVSMMIYYLSVTGNTRRFVEKLGAEYKRQSIKDENLTLEENSVFIFPTIGFGQPPAAAVDFLEKNSRYISYLVGSGNRNWGTAFAAGADKLSRQFNIPVLMKFELQGTDETLALFKEKWDAISRAKQPGSRKS